MFYVGRQGQFDAYLHSELKEYPQINYAVVLAYMLGKKTECEYSAHRGNRVRSPTLGAAHIRMPKKSDAKRKL